MLIQRAFSVVQRPALHSILALCALACDPPERSPTPADDAGRDEPPEGDADAATDSGAEPAAEAGNAPDTGPEEPQDAGGDGWVGPPPPPQAEEALCTDAYDSIALNHPDLIRGSWQYNPGGPYVDLPANGYPCQAFLHDGNVRPRRDDPGWTDAANGEFLGFSETSTVPEADYEVAQFRYFRSLVFVPMGAVLESLTVTALGIDDAVQLTIFNSKYPEGISPRDAGPSDPEVGACYGNDRASWDFRSYVVDGEVNVVFLVHADMNPATSTLSEVKIEANGAPIPLVSCKKT